MQEQSDIFFSFSKFAKAQFKKRRSAVWSLRLLIFLAIIALLAPIIANDKPLYCKYKGQTLFPAFSMKGRVEVGGETVQYDIADWKRMDLESVCWPLCVYSPEKSDFENADYVSPSGQQFFKDKSGEVIPMPARFRHWLGTNKKGEDVLAGLIYGTRISLTIGIFSMTLASLIGVALGAIAGYFGDRKLQTSRGKFWMVVIGIFMAYFYAFQIRANVMSDALNVSLFLFLLQFVLSLLIFAIVVLFFGFIGKLVSKLPFLRAQVFVPVDSFVSREIEILNSLPKLILIISISVIAKPSIWNIVLIIGFTNWTDIARLTRAEFLRTSQLDYVQAAKSIGLSETRIIFRHALPNSIAPAFIAIAFGIAGAILIESGLSFLGVGVAANTVTWGSLLSAARENFNAWWLILFPGLAIFLTVTTYNVIGEALREVFDPRLKH